ncbi:helix-turn-helix domain-containing protein [Verrucomicrobium spinosum]|uniref:helix-turn-helix domain-containing protein n=1 Tax=Verrucomicrobium spinosum TaxID=2736 RepID=UPI0012E14CEA|nr:helix-turn-helix domain-containing protein [Verrucomicrobium spinosum]
MQSEPTASTPDVLQSSFFRAMGANQQFRLLLEQVPDVEYFAKDLEGRFVAASEKTLKRLGFKHERDLLGHKDDFIHPASVAAAIRQDDLEVMSTKQPLIDRLELLYNRSNEDDWFLTTKIPISDVRGDVIGIMGFVRPFRQERPETFADVHIQKVVAYIRKHHCSRITVTYLASIANISQRQLNRKFQSWFRMSVQEYIMRIRIQAAGEELATSNKPIGVIALENGFYDQSFFTRYFRRFTGETPLVYRRNRLKRPV